MKITVYGEVTDELEIDIDEHSDVEDVRYDIGDLIGVFYFQMIYQNIILNDKMKRFRFNDKHKIWIGSLECFLKKHSDSVILELFIARKISCVVHIVANRKDVLATVKSTIECVIENISRIFNAANGLEIDYKQTVNDMEFNSEFKLIISTDENSSFGDCIKGHDEYLIRNYLSCNDLTYIWYRKDFNHSREKALKEMLRIARDIVAVAEPLLDVKLSSLPMSFVNCRFLFCHVLTNRICEICNNRYWKPRFHWMKYDEIVNCVFRQFFHDALITGILEFVDERLRNPLRVAEKTMRDFVIQALTHCNQYLEYPSKEWRYLIESFLSVFSFKKSITNSEIDSVIQKWIEEHSTMVIKFG